MRLALATAVMLLALAAPAWAQDDDQPVVGGGSFNAAPILEPGHYRDTLLPTEYLYYAFRLEPGQRLHVTANAEMPIDDFQRLGMSYITSNFHSPTRTNYTSTTDFDVRGSFRVEGEPPVDITGPYASAEEDTRTSGPWYGPGVYYVAFYAVHTGAGEPPRAEIPFHFEVTVEGEAQATATPSPSPSPTASPTPTPAPTVEEEGGAGAGVAVGFGVGGLLVGVVGGLVLRRRRD
jgi:hypothetical protein